MKTDTFSGFHPAVNFAYFLCVIGMTILIMQPIFLVLSLAGGWRWGSEHQISARRPFNVSSPYGEDDGRQSLLVIKNHSMVII